MNKTAKIGLIAFGALVVIALGYFIFPKSYIKISIAPDQASLSIDGGSPRQVTSGQTVFVLAGKHTYKVSRDQFDSQTVTITSANNETKEVLVALDPQTDAARALLNTANSQSVIQRVGSRKLDTAQESITKNYPILKDLPYTSHSFEIDACSSQKYPNDSSKIALCVYSNDPTGVQPIVEGVIKNLGYNPGDYEIIYEPAPSSSGSSDYIGN